MENSTGKKVFRGTVTIVLVGILAKITSFISEAILAAYLGTTYQSDAYYMVSSIQMVIYPMLSVGIWKVFLPIYKEKLTQGKYDEAASLTNKVITFFSAVSFVAVGLLILLAGPVVSIVAPGFEGETRALCIKLVRIAAPMYFFIIAAAIYASILQANNKFLGSQIREVASHIPTIIAAIFFYKNFGIEAMAVGLVAGGAVRLLIELPFVDWGYKYKPDFKFKSHEFGLMLKRLPSALISEGVTQLNTLIDKAMASTLATGTVSALNYGNKLTNVFSGLLSTAIATALYPQMIELIALKKEEDLSKLVVKIINIFCVLMIPITVAPHMVQHLYNELLNEKGLSPKTIKNLHGALHKAMEQAKKLGYIRTNPLDAVIVPRVEKTKIETLADEEMLRFLNVIKGEPDELIYYVTVFTGLRQGEVLGLTWDCVDFENNTLLINKQHTLLRQTKEYVFASLKNDKIRTLTVADEVMDALRKQKERQEAWAEAAGSAWSNPDQLVFTNELGRYVSNKTLYNRFKRLMKENGFDGLRFHSLRHTFAVNSLRAGDDIKTVQENLGHATASFTLSTYAHSTPGMKKESANRMGQYIKSLQSSAG